MQPLQKLPMAWRQRMRHHNWKGERIKTIEARIKVMRKSHPGADRGGYVFEHILVAEKALGRHLPKDAVIHHINGDTLDNSNGNLVIYQDGKFHKLLHRRARAVQAGAPPDFRQCYLCKGFSSPQTMSRARKVNPVYRHYLCANLRQNELRHKYKHPA